MAEEGCCEIRLESLNSVQSGHWPEQESRVTVAQWRSGACAALARRRTPHRRTQPDAYSRERRTKDRNAQNPQCLGPHGVRIVGGRARATAPPWTKLTSRTRTPPMLLLSPPPRQHVQEQATRLRDVDVALSNPDAVCTSFAASAFFCCRTECQPALVFLFAFFCICWFC